MIAALQTQWDQKQVELATARDQLRQEREILEEQHRLVASRQQEIQASWPSASTNCRRARSSWPTKRRPGGRPRNSTRPTSFVSIASRR